MRNNEMTDFIIKKYQEDEQIMIQLFVQWAKNNQLNSQELYKQAYPHQAKNKALQDVLDSVEPIDLEIDTATLIHLLQLFGNDDLAYVVSNKAEEMDLSN
ncbi:hypothetical protein [Paenisporosarcina cavernae]|uniref:Uncharacterized protein n=1 Tax=Paenisporosarcina cavernae TaxID=2320858 RepID=A0A385YUI1_9BACL|nr:hypothetical protein [Paenisporosarcina cavernae]AYC30214.1 hypothetical protein D3873_10250 [Paenisporosarcina cavernae]